MKEKLKKALIKKINEGEEIELSSADANKLLVVTCGQQDTRFFEAAKDFVEKCTELNIRHISMFSPARHRWPYWCWVIDQHLNWFRQEISGEGIGEGER